jgi:type II secretory ATPase GspE/PulE/Tfp pilus assembly ATPase PilB-like protein
MTQQDAASNIQDVQSPLAALLAEWGYPDATTAPRDLAGVASQIVANPGLRAGDYVVQLEFATQRQVDVLMDSKPANVLTLEYLSDKISNLRPSIQRIVALTERRPYYTTLPESPSALMADPAVRHACGHESVLIDTPSGRPCLVFTDNGRLKEFEQMARDMRANNALYGLHHAGPILALGQRAEIYRLANLDGGDIVANDLNSQTNVFTPEKATTDLQRMFVRMLDFAHEKQSSNIALQPQSDGIVIARYRRAAHMFDIPVVRPFSPDQGNELAQFLHRISQAKYTDDQATAEGRLLAPADGNLIYRSQEAEVFLRLAFTPMDSAGLDIAPESISIRLIPRKTTRVQLDQMKIKTSVIKAIESALRETKGLILLAGPTNSGKSTTIAGALTLEYELFGKSRNRLSIEHPKERNIPDVLQHAVTARNGYDLMTAALLRQDPDTVYVGEIRSRSSAAAAVRGSGTGSLMLSTIHAGDSIQAVPTLRAYINNPVIDNAEAAVVNEHDMIEALNLVVAQRLISHICPNCRRPLDQKTYSKQHAQIEDYCRKHGLAQPTEAQYAALQTSTYLANPEGCQKCDHTGYVGVVPINEVLSMTREVKDLLHRMFERRTFRYSELVRFRDRSLFDAALERILRGESQISDLFI